LTRLSAGGGSLTGWRVSVRPAGARPAEARPGG